MQRASLPLYVLLFLIPCWSACVESAAVVCASGRVCPPRSRCDEATDRCISDEQLAACADSADGDECAALSLTGTCLAGVCEFTQCGNGQLELDEICDDGNRQDGDGCRNDCRSDESCGNAITDYLVGEQCDCGDGTVAIAGCTTANSDSGGLCSSACRLRCGDGVIGADEACDGAARPFETCVLWQYDLGSLACRRCGFDFTGCHHIGWHEVLNGFDLSAIWGSDASNVFAVGALGTGGAVLRFDGSAWTASRFGAPFVDIDGRVANDVFAVTTPSSGSQIWHHDGTSWTLTSWPSSVSQTMRAVWGRGAGGANAVGDFGQIFEYNGTTCTKMNATALRGYTRHDVCAAAIHLEGVAARAAGISRP